MYSTSHGVAVATSWIYHFEHESLHFGVRYLHHRHSRPRHRCGLDLPLGLGCGNASHGPLILERPGWLLRKKHEQTNKLSKHQQFSRPHSQALVMALAGEYDRDSEEHFRSLHWGKHPWWIVQPAWEMQRGQFNRLIISSTLLINCVPNASSTCFIPWLPSEHELMRPGHLISYFWQMDCRAGPKQPDTSLRLSFYIHWNALTSGP